MKLYELIGHGPRYRGDRWSSSASPRVIAAGADWGQQVIRWGAQQLAEPEVHK